VSIDPFQSTQWDNTGRRQLQEAGLSALSRVIEEPSYLAMPALLREGGGGDYDLVLVDGMHLFDYTLVDIFYADLLTRVGGVILLDDIRHRGVAPVLDYLKTNYAHWRLGGSTLCTHTMATLVKLAPDTRAWSYHTPFAGGAATGAGGHRH